MRDDWKRSAACRGKDPALWFPVTGGTNAYDAGRAICADCTVRRDCLALVMSLETSGRQEVGLWAGLDDAERRRLRRIREAARRQYQDYESVSA